MIVIFAALLLHIINAQTTNSTAQTANSTCLCPTDYHPVCVDQQITFANECHAKCHDFPDFIAGECFPSTCVCPHDYEPVCANGRPYTNECSAKCVGITNYTTGPCTKLALCACPTTEYQPVCAGGLTYATRCLAECKGLTEMTDGQCFIKDNLGAYLTNGSSGIDSVIKSCANCSSVYNPVCIAGQSYHNKCFAKCVGGDVGQMVKGECDGCACNGPKYPVCSDGETFENPCKAHCAGKTTFTQGECI